MTPDIQTRATAQFLKASFLVSFPTKPSLERHPGSNLTSIACIHLKQSHFSLDPQPSPDTLKTIVLGNIMNFDEHIDRRNTHSAKWDTMELLYGVSPNDGLSMWVADMDFRPPKIVQDKLTELLDHGVYGYFGDDGPYLDAIQWWMKHRHGWEVPRDGVFTTHGLVNGTAMCIDTFTTPGDGIVLFTPVYYAFAKVIHANNREVIELPLVNDNGRYEMDFEAYDAVLPAHARMIVLCSPHNPGGRIWSRTELEQVAAFAKRHDLILVSDEIHHDLTFGAQTYSDGTDRRYLRSVDHDDS